MAIAGKPVSQGDLLDAIGALYPEWVVYFNLQDSDVGEPVFQENDKFVLALVADGFAVRPNSIVVGVDTYSTSLDATAEADLGNNFPATDYVSAEVITNKPLVSANELFSVQSAVHRLTIGAFTSNAAYVEAESLAVAEAASRGATIIGWLATLYWKDGDPVLIHQDDWVCRMLVAAKSFS